MTGSRGEGKSVEGEGVVGKAPGPTRPQRWIGWLHRWLVLGPVPNPDDIVFDDPPFDVAAHVPAAGKRVSKYPWRTLVTRRNWVS